MLPSFLSFKLYVPEYLLKPTDLFIWKVIAVNLLCRVTTAQVTCIQCIPMYILYVINDI